MLGIFYAMALILETINAMMKPKMPIIPNDTRRLETSAMYPMTGGPIRNPRKLTLETIVKASPGGTFGFFPATL